MFKTLIALAIAGATSVSAIAQPAPQPAPAANQAQPAKPQMIKKTVCEDNDNPFSHISRICHTVMVPAQPAPSTASTQQAPAATAGNR